LLEAMAEWVGLGANQYRERVAEGLENSPWAFGGILMGNRFGKPALRFSRR
jgi:NADPH-dependent curcumin reductase CurA